MPSTSREEPLEFQLDEVQANLMRAEAENARLRAHEKALEAALKCAARILAPYTNTGARR